MGQFTEVCPLSDPPKENKRVTVLLASQRAVSQRAVIKETYGSMPADTVPGVVRLQRQCNQNDQCTVLLQTIHLFFFSSLGYLRGKVQCKNDTVYFDY
ncbi:hypothetical protein ANANG_G00077320 [Anguilla anguilla]|uniref:Uncharacterized protein n=1 Tax=Anguilla anguilla TaxID=7936 RepID=A0A9D3MP66_ANGAN|nr:hypothetical protein ANANG_G00077320 [Anguilla anguilla]